MKRLLLIFLVCLLTGCVTVLQVTGTDPVTGYFPTSHKAKIVKNSKFDMDARKSLLVAGGEDFGVKMINNINYFDNIITPKELEKEIIKNGLADKIPNINNQIGLHNAATKYKKFLYVSFQTRRIDNKPVMQFVVTDPVSMEDIFIAEAQDLPRNDQTVFYPLYNALIDYIRENSETYQK